MKNAILAELQRFQVSHGNRPSSNLDIRLEYLPLLTLLKGQSSEHIIYPTIFWQDKEKQQSIACFGKIDEMDTVPFVVDDACYFGGLAFQQDGEQWDGFPALRFIRPVLAFKVENESLTLTCHFDGKQEIEATMAMVEKLQPPVELSDQGVEIKRRTDKPNKEDWARLVDLAIENKALLPKVVLSRETRLQCDKKVNQWDMLHRWHLANKNSFLFAFQFSKGSAFIGCSPERLFSRENNKLETEALAGTVNRGRNDREDNILLESLLSDRKIDRENHLVQEFIIANLKKLKADVICDTPRVMQLHNVQHLCIPISATLCAGTKDAQILDSLHPTPAVGGTPKEQALQFIHHNEPYLRGWYAGAVGYICKEKSDFSVAIRSALILDKQVKLFAGAGIVTGSIANQEWEELDNKISTVLNVITNK
jgi:menaquinone-specific isochorismate synthase